ncbi:MAG: hypothetical protein II254_02730, partial [Oscillospiraceae bacterium]|nr:hypothetical protein [Oscillospiraceae bacterium]
YCTDGVSAAIFRKVCAKADVPVQTYCNRADIPGGSTLGNISLHHVSVPTVDIGLALQFKNNSLSEQEFARRIHRGDTEHFMEHYIDYKNEYYSPLVAE